MARPVLLLVTLALGITANLAFGKFASPQLEKVPVERLIKNLKIKAKKNPDKVEFHYALARVYAMSFAIKGGEVDVRKGTDDVFWGFTPNKIPYSAVKPVTEKGPKLLAQEHLAFSVLYFRKALKLDETNPDILLGLGWSYDRSKKKKDAIKTYRLALERYLEKDEKTAKDGKIFGPNWSGAVETASYLIPLLDGKKDKKEIDQITTRVEKLKKVPYAITPVLVALNAKSRLSDLLDRDASVAFDLDGSGEKKTWDWITPKAAWLAWAPHGRITSGRDLFGSITFWLFWNNGYEALSALDNDQSGQLEGNELDGLVLWHDADSDGIASPHEITSVSEAGLTKLHLNFQNSDADTLRVEKGVEWANGERTDSWDVILYRK